MIDDAIYLADAVSAAFSWTDCYFTVLLVGLVGYFALIAPPGKIGMTGPTDDPPRVQSAKEIEDLEGRGKIW